MIVDYENNQPKFLKTCNKFSVFSFLKLLYFSLFGFYLVKKHGIVNNVC